MDSIQWKYTHQNWRVIKVSIDFSAFSISNASNHFDSVDILWHAMRLQSFTQPLLAHFVVLQHSIYIWRIFIDSISLKSSNYTGRSAISHMRIQFSYGLLLLALFIECITIDLNARPSDAYNKVTNVRGLVSAPYQIWW